MKKNIIIAILSLLPSLVWAQDVADDNIFAQLIDNPESACYNISSHRSFTHNRFTTTLMPENTVTTALGSKVLVVNFEHKTVASYSSVQSGYGLESDDLYFTFAEYASRNTFFDDEFLEGSEQEQYNARSLGLRIVDLLSITHDINKSISTIESIEQQAAAQEGLVSEDHLKILTCAKELLKTVK